MELYHASGEIVEFSEIRIAKYTKDFKSIYEVIRRFKIKRYSTRNL